MANTTLYTLAQANGAALPATDAAPAASAKIGDSGQKFADTLASALNAQAADKPSAAASAQAAAPANSADANQRARQTLQLGASSAVNSSPVASSGDVVLQGLQKLRGVFDVQLSNLANSTSGSNLASSQNLLDVQMSYATFGIVTDVASKLTGKGADLLNQLLKGQ